MFVKLMFLQPIWSHHSLCIDLSHEIVTVCICDAIDYGLTIRIFLT